MDKKELTEFEKQAINSIIGSSKHEGYVDDGFSRYLLEQISLGEITQEEAKEIILRKCKARDAHIIASLDNDSPLSDYAKELNERWINGEITSKEELQLLIKKYSK